MFNIPGVVLAMIALMGLIQVAMSHVFDADAQRWMIIEFAFIPARYAFDAVGGDGPWFWTPVSYSLLHGGWAHFGLNSFWLAAFGGLVARRIGVGRFVMFWVLAAIASAMLFLAMHWADSSVMVGASGVVSALMAAAARFAFSGGGFSRQHAHLSRRLSILEALTNRTVIAFLAVWFGINLLAAGGFSLGATDAAIAWEAHVGGFLFGFLTFSLFDPIRRR
ncbi:rhomboid family intramembrane serine protease [Hoeflea marina]|nr:rhomboid family intramembrane serine protease [Hoeflea marina]